MRGNYVYTRVSLYLAGGGHEGSEEDSTRVIFGAVAEGMSVR